MPHFWKIYVFRNGPFKLGRIVLFSCFVAKEVKQLKWGYLKQFWNWVEIIIIILSWVSFGLIISYVVGVEVTMNQIKAKTNYPFCDTIHPLPLCASRANINGKYLKLCHWIWSGKNIAIYSTLFDNNWNETYHS